MGDVQLHHPYRLLDRAKESKRIHGLAREAAGVYEDGGLVQDKRGDDSKQQRWIISQDLSEVAKQVRDGGVQRA